MAVSEDGQERRRLPQQPQQHVYRTTPARTGKMMAIMLGICVVGGVIFFAMWDYWMSEPAPIVAIMAASSAAAAPPAPPPPSAVGLTGETITADLVFVEGDDFVTMAFNEMPGEEGSNPTINVNVGDKVVFNVRSDGISFHSFGVTREESGLGGVIPDTEIGTANSPLMKGDSGTAEFVATEAGTYYYICTVPGHRALGMEGMIVVADPAAGGDGAGKEAAPPTGVLHEFEFDFVESDDFMTFGFNALEGEEGANPDIVVNSGDEIAVTTTNVGISFHSFGVVQSPEDFTNVLWDSAIGSPMSPLTAGESGSVTFTAGAPGQYYYICTVPGHALQGMQGVLIVE